MKNTHKILPIIIISALCMFFILMIIYASINNNEEIKTTSFTPSIPDYDGSVLAVSVNSKSSTMEDGENNKITLKDINEAIHLSFGQQGKNRDVVLRIYYDFKPIKFKVGMTQEFSDKYVFESESKTERSFDVYLDSELEADAMSHALIIDFVCGYTTYAKDLASQTDTYSATELFHLTFLQENTNGKKENIDSGYPIQEADKYLEFNGSGFVLNTEDLSELVVDDVIKYPDKCYNVKKNTLFTLKYMISDMNPSAENLLLFLTVGHETVKVSGQDYLWIDLQDKKLATGLLSFKTPDIPGIYDVIGYAVYNPFDNNDIVYCYPKTSVRFSIVVE